MESTCHSRLYLYLVQTDLVSSAKDQVDSNKVLQQITVQVDSVALLEYDSYLGNCLVGNFPLFSSILQEVLFEVLIEHVESKNQILPIVRPSPLLQQQSDFYNPRVPSDSTSLVSYRGRIVCVRDPVSYTHHTKYRCSTESCKGTDDSAHIRIHTLKSRECDVINPNLRCTVCCEPLYEDVSKRNIGRRMSLELEILGTEEKVGYYVEQSVTVVVRDSLLALVALGGRISVVGLPLTKLYANMTRLTVEAVNIIPYLPSLPHLIPHSVRDLHAVRERSPWQLLGLLAFCVTPEGVPQGAYHTLKQLLLLSSVRSDPVTDRESPLYLPTVHPGHLPAINILVQARDTEFVRRTLEMFSRFHLHNREFGVGQLPLCGSREGDRISAGSLIKATGGVAILGDVDLMKKDDKASLMTVLQNRAVIIGKKKSEIFPLSSVIWGYRQDTPSKATPPPWDIIYQVCKDCDSESVMECVLGEEAESILPDGDVRAYLTLASSIRIQFDESCTHLIAGYCQAAKSVRYGSGGELPLNASYTLHLLASNHARINYRDMALDVDAVIAIKLFEESLFSHQRYSTLELNPSNHINIGEQDTYLGEKVDTKLETLYSKIVQFCSTHIPGFTVDNED